MHQCFKATKPTTTMSFATKSNLVLLLSTLVREVISDASEEMEDDSLKYLEEKLIGTIISKEKEIVSTLVREVVISEVAQDKEFNDDSLKCLVEKLIDTLMSSKEKENNKEKTKKKEKDPNKPKRPESSFLLWSKMERTKLKKSNPLMDSKEIMKELGRIWKSLTDEEKASFDNESNDKREKYKKEMEDYNKTNKIEKEDKSVEKPKRKMSPYDLFKRGQVEEARKVSPKIKIKDIERDIKNEWNRLKASGDDEDKVLLKDLKEQVKLYNESIEESTTKSSKKKLIPFDIFKKKIVLTERYKNPKVKVKDLLPGIKEEWEILKANKNKYKEFVIYVKMLSEKDNPFAFEISNEEEDEKTECSDEVKNLFDHINDIFDKYEEENGKECNITKKIIKQELTKRNIEFTNEEFKQAVLKIRE